MFKSNGITEFHALKTRNLQPMNLAEKFLKQVYVSTQYPLTSTHLPALYTGLRYDLWTDPFEHSVPFRQAYTGAKVDAHLPKLFLQTPSDTILPYVYIECTPYSIITYSR